MKRFRFCGEEEEEAEVMESFSLANVLMLLSKGSDAGAAGPCEAEAARVFECKTCSRRFPSFQALGGHRASHKKPRLGGADGPDRGSSAPAKARVHECSVCGLEFAIGQALGGHMRRHRVTAEVNGAGHIGWAGEKGQPLAEKAGVGLDLNLLPPLEAVEVRRLPKLLSFTLAQGTVDCLL